MVKLEAMKRNMVIWITEDSFEHLLSCLDNQKFVGEAPPNGDALAMGEEAYNETQIEIQEAIDDFNKQCRELLHGEDTPDPSCGSGDGCGGCSC